MPDSINVPMPFDGTPEQRYANVATHHFTRTPDDVECWDCGCKPWHVAATYPCGTIPPRKTIVFGGSDETV